MKKIVLILIALISLVSFAFKPSEIQNDKKLISSGKWRMEYIKISGKKAPLPPDMIKNSWTTYHPDGRAEGVDHKGMSINGKWEYLKDQKSIKILNKNGTIIQHIVSINNSKLVLSIKQHQQEVTVGLMK